MTYVEKLKDPRWQKKRLLIFQRDNFTCQLCGDKNTTLHVHHTEYIPGKEPWEVPDDLLQTLCDYCHLSVERLKEAKRDAKIISVLKHAKPSKSGRLITTYFTFVDYKDSPYGLAVFVQDIVEDGTYGDCVLAHSDAIIQAADIIRNYKSKTLKTLKING